MRAHTAIIVFSILVPATAGCAGEAANAGVAAVRDTLPNGAVRVRYAALDTAPVVVEADLRVGAVDGDPNFVFGDVRSVEAGSDGTLYVLDVQASEVRAFDGAGRFLRTVATRGEGPGEISGANGMQLVGDTMLWVQDHGTWMMLGLSTAGDEIARVPMPVRSYGYVWNGAIDDHGRFWKPATHDERPLPLEPPEGLNEGVMHEFFKGWDPATETSDSVYLGKRAWRSWVLYRGSGRSFYGVPFDALPITRIDPAGGFWRAHTGDYRIARLDEAGDTTLVIEAAVDARPVTDAEREEWVETASARGAPRRSLEQIVALAGGSHPVIAGLTVDDRGRLWVQRDAVEDTPPIFDVFARDGTYHGSIRPAFRPASYMPLRIRAGRMYAIVRDSMGVSYVVRAAVPFGP